jgi:hypothetical protein
MNRRFGAALACGCWGLIFVGMSAAPSANAALTPIGIALDHTDEPNLLGNSSFPGNQNPSVIETLYGEQNVRRIDDDRDDFFVFTKEVATFTLVARFSQETFGLSGADTSGAGYYPIMYISHGLMGYNFFAPWEFYMERDDFPPEFQLHYDGPRVRLSSDSDALRPIFLPMTNNAGRDHMVTFQVIGNEGRPNNPIGSYVLAWDDGMSRFGDRDFQDTVIQVTGIAPSVPEPPTAVTATLVALVAAAWRVRRSGSNGFDR